MKTIYLTLFILIIYSAVTFPSTEKKREESLAIRHTVAQAKEAAINRQKDNKALQKLVAKRRILARQGKNNSELEYQIRILLEKIDPRFKRVMDWARAKRKVRDDTIKAKYDKWHSKIKRDMNMLRQEKYKKIDFSKVRKLFYDEFKAKKKSLKNKARRNAIRKSYLQKLDRLFSRDPHLTQKDINNLLFISSSYIFNYKDRQLVDILFNNIESKGWSRVKEDSILKLSTILWTEKKKAKGKKIYSDRNTPSPPPLFYLNEKEKQKFKEKMLELSQSKDYRERLNALIGLKHYLSEPLVVQVIRQIAQNDPYSYNSKSGKKYLLRRVAKKILNGCSDCLKK